MMQYIDTVQDESGNAIPGVTVTVTIYPSGNLATLYSDFAGNSPITQAGNDLVFTDLTGQFKFFAPDNYYSLTFSRFGTVFKVQSPVTIADAVSLEGVGFVTSFATPNGTLALNHATGAVTADVVYGTAANTAAQGNTALATAGATNHGVLLGTGGVTVGAVVMADGQINVGQTGADPQAKTLSGDGTLSAAGAITVTKTNGVSFAASATTDTTVATNISSGTLPTGRLPALTGDVTTSAGSAVTTLAAGSASNLNSGTLLAARMPALTGDVTTSAGAVATTIAANAVTNAKAAQMAAHTHKGNNTGSTANALDLTVTQLTAELNSVVGDSGSGGTKGLVPAPAAGDAAAGRFLKADGNWVLPPGAGGITNGTATVATSETTASTSYTDLATPGPAITVTTGTAVLISISARVTNGVTTQEDLVSVAVSGASTVAASDTVALSAVNIGSTAGVRGSSVFILTGLTAGSNTFTLKYRVTAGTGTFKDRSIAVLALN